MIGALSLRGAHEAEPRGRTPPRQGRFGERERVRRGCADQLPIARDRAPDEERAAVAGAPELPADMGARQPDEPVANPTEDRGARRSDDPDVLKRHQIIGVFRGHGTILLRDSAPTARWEGPDPDRPRCGGSARRCNGVEMATSNA